MTGIIGQDPRGRSGIVNQFTDVGLNTSLDSEWHSSMNAVQINSGSLSAHDSYPHYVQLNANVVQKDSGEKRVNNSYKASQHRQWDGEHIFKVAPAASGDISWTTAMTIKNDGDIYSTGWTFLEPTAAGFDFSTGSVVKVMYYMRIGYMVYIVGSILGTSNQDYKYISNLPYTSDDTVNVYPAMAISYAENGSNYVGEVYGRITPDSTRLDFLLNGNYNGWSQSNYTYVRWSGWYRANSI